MKRPLIIIIWAVLLAYGFFAISSCTYEANCHRSLEKGFAGYGGHYSKTSIKSR